MSQKFAVFDIDGTLFRWQLFHELVAELGNQDLFPKDVATTVEEKFFEWRALKATWADYEREVVKAIIDNIAAIPPNKLSQCAETVVERSGHKVYNFTSDLVKKLKNDGYFLLALTGSQQEIAELFAKKHGFDDCIGSLMRRDSNGNFTSEFERFVIGNKSTILTNYCNEHGFDLNDDSYGVGDSEGDASMLELVTSPIAFNPDEGLLKLASSNNWTVVIERKNLAYVMKVNDETLSVVETKVF
ncbi:HAD-IB family phosphatase [Candidatus Saccharibacteria bacterium]|nr:HAD-IB family phosphatase [Candidatus Saccharibacteria bacterium]